MRKTFYLSVAAIAVASGLFYLGSCTTDYEEPGLSNLDIEDQIMRGKRLNPEIDINPDPSYIPQEDSMCAVYALVSLYPKSKWESGIGSLNERASDYYYDMVEYAEKEYGYQRGISMPFSTTLEVGKHFGLLSGEQSFVGSGHSANIHMFFMQNKGKIKIVNVAGHTAKFKSFDSKTGTVHLYGTDPKYNTCNVRDVISVFY